MVAVGVALMVADEVVVVLELQAARASVSTVAEARAPVRIAIFTSRILL
jgi:hypothetical protein